MNSSKKKPKHHELQHDFWTWMATIGRVGFARKAPGTFGSLVALPLAFGVRWGFEQAGLVSSVKLAVNAVAVNGTSVSAEYANGVAKSTSALGVAATEAVTSAAALGGASSPIADHVLSSNLAMTGMGLGVFLILFLFATVFGWFAISHTEKKWDLHDASCIVVDEVLAQLAVLIWWPFSWTLYAVGFGLFRLFDIWKPWPIRNIDRGLHGAWGTLLDDYAAGIYAVAILGVMKIYLPL